MSAPSAPPAVHRTKLHFELGGENVKITPTTTHMTKKATPTATAGDIQSVKPWASKGPQNPPMKHGHQRHIGSLSFDRSDSEFMD
jgi:hypothetical protein